MSQTTQLDDPNAERFLERDVHNICKLFEKFGVKTDEEKVLKQIKKVK
jgi:serine/threonine-protein kinase RIO1